MALKKRREHSPYNFMYKLYENKYIMQLLTNYEQYLFCIDESGYMVYNLIRKKGKEIRQ